MNKVYTLLIMFVIGIYSCQQSRKNEPIQYPITDKTKTTDNYFGTEVKDKYRWLENDTSKATAQWVKKQNKVTFSYLDRIPYRQKLKKRLEELYNYERIYAPVKHGEYEYLFKNDGLQNQNVLYRRKNEKDSLEVFLDPNTFSGDGTISLASTKFSSDGSLLVYLISIGGSDWRKALIMDTKTKKIIADTLHNIKFSALAWNGNEGLYYSSYDSPKEGSMLSGKNLNHKLYYHKLGTPQSKDNLIFGGKKNPYRYVYGFTSEDNRFLFIGAAKQTTGSVLFVKDLKNNPNKLIQIDDNITTEENVLMSDGDRIIIETNLDAPNNKIVEVNINKPKMKYAKDVIPETKNAITTVNTAGNNIFVSYLIDVKTEVKQFDSKGTFIRKVELPGIGTAYGFGGKKEEKELFYTFTAFTSPNTIYRYNIKTGETSQYLQAKVKFNPEDYNTEQVFYESKDGTKIPMFIVYKKGIKKDGKNPTLLYGYGGFNISLKPSFKVSIIVWLENGGIYAQPNIRGGGEYGEKWHKSGTKMNKQNVFDDFIAAAKYLIDNGFTSSDHLAIEGRSNGGLLVGATMTQEPQLAKVALAGVGVLDMLRYHKFTAGAGWAYDYGTADESKEMFEYLYAYSPLHNLRPNTEYPATLVTTADHDDRVVPAHSFKFIARLQEIHQGENPVLIRIETDAGHGSGTPISKRIEQISDKFSFTWYAMDYNPPLL